MHPTTTTALKAQIRARDRNEGNIDNCTQIFFFQQPYKGPRIRYHRNQFTMMHIYV